MNRTVLEFWRDVEGYEGLYQVSHTGKVRSLDRRVYNGKGHYIKKGRFLKQSKTTTGYLKVELFKNGLKKSMKVHRLVAIAFIEKKEGKEIINHIDGNPLNNNVGNLEWCNQSENMKHAYETGLMKSNFTKHKKRILKEYQNNKSSTINGLSRKYECSESSIRKYFRRIGVKIRGISQTQDVYKINRQKMIIYFEKGLSNKEIAEKLNANNSLIARYKYMHKKGELKI